MRILLDNSAFVENPSRLSQVFTLLREDATFLRSSYPNFDSWLLHKVIPGVVCGERTVILEMRAAEVAGFMILKHSSSEKKLCTLRVRPQYESLGMGVRLFDTAFEILNTERPLLSVSEKAVPKFATLFNHFGFSREAIYEDRYLPRVRELSYNGLLDESEPTREASHRPSRVSPARSQSSFSASPC
jgi:ribosomal protein S18 acetylase RimI-like enzyme